MLYPGCTQYASNMPHKGLTHTFVSKKMDNRIRTSFHLAVIGGHIFVMDEILTMKIDLENMLTEQGDTIVCLECQQQPTGRCKIFAREAQHEKPRDVGNNGNTILHLATLEKLPHISSSF